MNVILTGATGMVGEGVLLECLENPAVNKVLVIGRKPYESQHPKFNQLIVSDFNHISAHADSLNGYDACFFCAGVSSIGMNEADYTAITYDTTMTFAKELHKINSNMVFNFVTGAGTDSTETGKIMWARVKGKTENDLSKLGFRGQYNFRPAIMMPTKGQKSLKTSYRIAAAILKYIMPKSTLTLKQVGQAMIHSVTKGYHTSTLEVSDIKALAK